MVRRWFHPLLLASLTACSGATEEDEDAVSTPASLLAAWAEATTPLWLTWQAAEWDAAVDLRHDDATLAQRAVDARIAWQLEVGNTEWLTAAREVLATAGGEGAGLVDEEGDPMTIDPGDLAAIDTIRVLARSLGETNREQRAKRDREFGNALRAQASMMPRVAGRPVSGAEVAARYRESSPGEARDELWRSLMAPAREVKASYSAHRDAANQAARKAGWDNHLDAALWRYDLEPADLSRILLDQQRKLFPLYEALHTWARHELARHHQQPVPEQIPVTWLSDPLGQTWSGTFQLAGLDPTPTIQALGPQEVLQRAEGWFTGVGLPGLPASVWEHSSLYPPSPGGPLKAAGASTWDIDLAADVRLLLNTESTPASLHDAHRELAFAHALVEKHTAGVPTPLRTLGPGVFEGALAAWVDLAASRPTALGLTTPDDLDPVAQLLDEALTWVPYLMFAASTAPTFEREVYAGRLPAERFTPRWWELMAENQGLVPPEARGDRWADPLMVGRLVDAPGRYFEQALAIPLAFQLNEKAAQDAGLDPGTATFRTPEAGAVFRTLAATPTGRDWQRTVRDATGARYGMEAMLRHFEPLKAWLDAQNEGRTSTLKKP